MLKKISQTTFLQAINVGIPFLTIPWFVSKLGISGYGQIGAALAMMQFLQLVVDYGFTLTAARSIAISNKKLIDGSQLFADITAIKISVFLLGIIATSAVIHVIGIQPDLENLIFIGFILVLGQALTPTWLFLGRHESKRWLWLTILPKILMVPVIFLLIRGESDLSLAMFLNVIPYLCTGILCIWIAIKNKFIRFEKPNFSRMKEETINAFPLFKSSVATSATTFLTPLIINGISGPHALGIYLIADKIRQGIQSILMPISSVAFPKITEEFSISQNVAFYTIKRLGMFLLIFVISVAIITSIFSSKILITIFGNVAADATDTLRILMLVTVFTFCNSIIFACIILPLGRDKEYSKIIIFVSLLHVVLIWPFVANHSHIGAAAALAISEFFLLCLMLRDLLFNSIDSAGYRPQSSILYKVLTSRKTGH